MHTIMELRYDSHCMRVEHTVDTDMHPELFIDGEFIEGSSGERVDVVDPATTDVIGSAPDGSAEDAEDAVTAAEAAFEEEWRHVDARERGKMLLDTAEAIENRFEELVELETLENGKPLEQSRADVREAVRTFRYYGGAADKNHGETVPELDGVFNYTVREPYGVVASIIPWNWPPMHTADFTAPILATGNTVVLKPAPETPLSSLTMAEIFANTLPDGVVNVVTGGLEPGVRLTAHPSVDKIAFTGHSSSGAAVMQSAADSITDVMLELGGKNPSIVLPDADVDAAVDGTIGGLTVNAGQACAGCERLLLHEAVADEFLDRFVQRIDQLRIGSGLDPETDIGPLSTQPQYEKVTEAVERAKEAGATVRYEGTIPDGVGDGYFVAPVVFESATGDLNVDTEEVFGPVLSVRRFTSVEDAIEMANDTEYGLTAVVWSDNMQVANRMARRIDAGIVCINNFLQGSLLGTPFGGFKRSGIGRKLAFEETLQEFTRSKAIRTAIADSEEGSLDTWYE